MPKIQFATQSYKLPELPVSAQRCINMYAEREPKDAKDEVIVLGTPGLTLFAGVGSGPIRGMRPFNNLLYIVSGGTLYSLAQNGTIVNLGGTVTGTSNVSMSDNGQAGGQIIIVNQANGYVWSALGGFQLITNINFFPARTVDFFDNYFVLDRIGTNEFFLSNLLDGTTYQATNIASADGQPGNVLATINQQNNLLVFGEQHIETWYDSGSPTFPFQRYDGATMERGIAAGFTAIKEDNAVFFLGDDLMFYRLDGTKLTRQSTHALEAEWQTYVRYTDAFCFSFTWNGHKMIALTFPTQLRTFILDLASGLWHERVSWDMFNNPLGRWRGNCYAKIWGLDLIGDAFGNQIGILDGTVNTEYGNVIQAQVVSPPIHNDRLRNFMRSLEIDMMVGVGAVSGQGSIPQVIMDFSDDGGRTFKSPQRFSSFGALGAYLTRVRWTRLGSFRQRVIRLTITDPVPRTIISATAEIKGGMR